MAGNNRIDAPRLTAVRAPHRRRVLEELLDIGARRRVCVVIGVAGWGKTSMVASWASGTTAAWVRCDGNDQSMSRLLHDIDQAMEPHLRVPVPTSRAGSYLHKPDVSGAGELCGRLRGSLSEDLVLVVDDLQELLPGSGAALLLDGMCRHAPDGLHLVLISRQEPPFSLRRLRGQGLVAEISAAELCLDVDDVTTLLDKTIGETPPGLSARICERTGGWPAAVNSAVELLRGVEPDQRLGVLEQLSSPGERLHEYLAEEVVGREREPAQALLCRIALRGEAGSRIGVDDDASLLADLTRRGLVRRDPSDSARWSLVPPLRDYFDHETVLAAGERTALHSAVGKECLARDVPGDALRHLVAAGEHAACAALLREHGGTLVSGDQVAAVLKAASLPSEHLSDPSIQLVLGEAMQVTGQFAGARECLERAGQRSDALEAAVAWRMAKVAFMQGEFTEVRTIYRRTRMAAEDTVDEAMMLTLVAMTCRMIGDMVNLRDAATHAVAAARRCEDPGVWAAVHRMLACKAGAEGDRGTADAHLADALIHATASNDLFQVAVVHVAQAAHLLEFGQPRQAFAEAQTALRLSERCANPFLSAQALTFRGRANARVGELDPAIDDLARAVEIFQRIGSRFLAWPLCGLGDVHRTRGQLARARAAYEEALALAEPRGDVLGTGSALIGLARVLAADDPTAALRLAERAVGLREGLREIPATLTRAWLALRAGDRQAAASDAAIAGSTAGMRRDNPGLAEALVLRALVADHPSARSTLLSEAIDIWREVGCLVEEAAARLIAAYVGVPVGVLGAESAQRTLLERGVDISGRGVGPLGAMKLFAPPVSIRTLGAFQVIRDGVPIPNTAWQSKKARELVKLLVTRRRPVPREQLMELLWPGTDGTRSGNRLSVLMSTVRDVLAPERDCDGPLATDGTAVWLDRRLVNIDVEVFLARAVLALDAHRSCARDSLAWLVEAETGYTGDFLEDDPYHDWAQPLAEEVRAAHIALLRALVGRLREASDIDGIVRYTLRLLAHDPYDEQAHLDLVTIQLEAGRLGEAHRRYRLYAQRMKEMRIAPHPMPVVPRTPTGDDLKVFLSQP